MLSTTNANHPAGQYVPASTELDAITLPESQASQASTQPAGERFIDLYSWWQKVGSETTPFVVVDKTHPPNSWVTTHIQILLVGDSNRHVREIEGFWKAVDAGIIENITYR